MAVSCLDSTCQKVDWDFSCQIYLTTVSHVHVNLRWNMLKYFSLIFFVSNERKIKTSGISQNYHNLHSRGVLKCSVISVTKPKTCSLTCTKLKIQGSTCENKVHNNIIE